MISTTVSVVPAQQPGSTSLRSVKFAGPAGRIEGLLNTGAPNAPFVGLVCHPHPKGGGTLHNKVVYHAMKALNAPEFGLHYPVLRFNFRGTGLSEGIHDGEAEVQDVIAALNWLDTEFKKPVVVVGFSFGAAMALTAVCETANAQRISIRALVALGLPTHVGSRHYQYPSLASCSLPKLFISGDSDEFASSAELVLVAATTAEPKKLVLLPGADHFFAGQIEAMQYGLVHWLKEQLS